MLTESYYPFLHPVGLRRWGDWSEVPKDSPANASMIFRLYTRAPCDAACILICITTEHLSSKSCDSWIERTHFKLVSQFIFRVNKHYRPWFPRVGTSITLRLYTAGLFNSVSEGTKLFRRERNILNRVWANQQTTKNNFQYFKELLFVLWEQTYVEISNSSSKLKKIFFFFSSLPAFSLWGQTYEEYLETFTKLSKNIFSLFPVSLMGEQI
jgi:hypothetical protein